MGHGAGERPAPGQLDLLLLLVSELVTNRVRHSGPVPRERVQIAVERRDGTIHVDVQNNGPGSIAVT